MAYALVRVLRSGAVRLLILLVAVTGIVLVGLSRIYLGIEYPSDLLGGLALGLFFLALLITAVEITERFHLAKRVSVSPSAKRPLLIATAAAALLAVTVGAAVTPLREVQAQSQSRILPSLDADGVRQLPVYSETLTGARMEHISFIYLGDEACIDESFNRAGWFKADPSTPGKTAVAPRKGIRHRRAKMAAADDS